MTTGACTDETSNEWAGYVEESTGYNLDTRYCGVVGIINSTHTTPFLHALLHCEDWVLTDSTDTDHLCDNNHGDGYAVYHRIGYARSAQTGHWTDSLYLDKIEPDEASDVPETSPPDWVKGGWGGAILTASYTEAEFYDARGDRPCGGIGQPQILKNGDYYYMFYTVIGYDSLGTTGGVCVARAPASLLNAQESTYEEYSRNDVWTKYNSYGSWNQPAIGGEDIPVLIRASAPKVSWNDSILEWCMFNEREEGLYINISDGGVHWYDNWGDGVWLHCGRNATGETGDICCYYPTGVGSSSDGTDKLTSRYNWFYYALVAAGEDPGHYTLKRRRLMITK